MKNRQIKFLKRKIEEASGSGLESLKVSIQVSDLHPEIKRACLTDIDRKQNRSVYHGIAIAETSELRSGEM